jgi:ATP-binding cassette subfamily F protein uup
MHQISLENIDKSFPETVVLDGASLGISAGQKIGVIGRNGSGKSTLLGIIAGEIEHDAGDIIRSSGLRVTTLSQDPRYPDGATVGEVVGSDRKAIALADRLGLVSPHIETAHLSGGQRKRLALAVALAADTDVLILDEPTNHLDVDTIDWLEDHLLSVTSTVLLVTHDRYLLDRVATRIVEVHDHRLYPHQGSYEEFLTAKSAREAIEAVNDQKRKQRIRTELAWLRQNPKARTSKSQFRTKRATELVETGQRRVRSELTIDLPTRRIGSKVVNLHNVGKVYDDTTVLSGITHRLQPDARIGIVGPNGAGKTTLLALIASRIEPTEGKVTTGSTIVAGWYGQDPTPLPESMRVLEAVREHADQTKLASGSTVSAPKLLEMFQFTRSEQQAAVSDLSGGERRRLELLLVLMGTPNLLLLDEPTNDLDLDTLQTLEEYLDAWKGAMVVASHDRYFLDRVCDDIFSIQPDGTVVHHPGGWSAYWAEHQLTNQRSRAKGPATGDQGASNRPKPVRTKLTYNDQRELSKLPARISKLEVSLQELTEVLGSGGGSPNEASDIGTRLATLIKELDTAENRWLELSDRAEQLATEGPA